jgi:DNA-binding LytR/AlgR family response regulator
MKVVIIEDEKPAAEKLQQAVERIDKSYQVIAQLHSVQATIEWLQGHEQPDLLFMDIELSDGTSFKIFEYVSVSCPVIFTTAYDEYWQEAFEYNCIDYLLKPIKQNKLEAALVKYDRLKKHFSGDLQRLLQWPLKKEGNEYKKRWLVKRGAEYATIKTEDIAYLYATHKLVCMVDIRNQKFILDKSLADIEKELDPALFFRINRKYLAQINAITKMRAYPKGKILVELQPAIDEEIIISQEQSAAFKEWVGG